MKTAVSCSFFLSAFQFSAFQLHPNTPFPLFPASGPATSSFNGLHPKSKFLAMKTNKHNSNVIMKIVIVLTAIFGISFSLAAKEVPYPKNKLPGDAHGATCTCVVCPGIKKHNDGQAGAGGRNASTGQCTVHPSQPATACSECKKLKEIAGTKQAALPSDQKPAKAKEVYRCPHDLAIHLCKDCGKVVKKNEARVIDKGSTAKCPHGSPHGSTCYRCSHGDKGQPSSAAADGTKSAVTDSNKADSKKQ